MRDLGFETHFKLELKRDFRLALCGSVLQSLSIRTVHTTHLHPAFLSSSAPEQRLGYSVTVAFVCGPCVPTLRHGSGVAGMCQSQQSVSCIEQAGMPIRPVAHTQLGICCCCCCSQDLRDVADAPADKQAARSSPESTDTDLKMDQGPAKSETKSDSTTGAGLVSNTALLTVSAKAMSPTVPRHLLLQPHSDLLLIRANISQVRFLSSK